MSHKYEKYQGRHLLLETEQFNNIFKDSDYLNKLLKLLFSDENISVLNNMHGDSKKLVILGNSPGQMKTIHTNKFEIIKSAFKNINLLDFDNKSKELIIDMHEKYRYDRNKISIKAYEVQLNDSIYVYDVKKFLDIIDILKSEEKSAIKNKYEGDSHMFAFIEFYDNYLKNNFIMGNEIEDKVNTLKEAYDLSSYRIKNFGKSSHLINDLIIDEKYKEDIYNRVPKLLHKRLDKALYIYLLMCKDFSYDAEVFAQEEMGSKIAFHRNLNNLKYINKDNPEVVCFSFSAIYASFLKELGIKFDIKSRDSFGRELDSKNFGEGHQYIKILEHPFIIKVDATAGVIESDLFNVKMKNELNGICVTNVSEDTRKHFKERMDLVVDLFNAEELQNENEFVDQSKYDEIVLAFKVLDNINKFNLDEKIEILRDSVDSAKLSGMDIYSYFINLRKIIFNKEERQKKISLEILADSTHEKTVPVIVISKNDVDNKKYSEFNEYYLYYPHKHFKKILKEDLEFLCNEDLIKPIKGHAYIPGIIEEDFKCNKIIGMDGLDKKV